MMMTLAPMCPAGFVQLNEEHALSKLLLRVLNCWSLVQLQCAGIRTNLMRACSHADIPRKEGMVRVNVQASSFAAFPAVSVDQLMGV